VDFGSIHRPAHGWRLSIQTSLSDLLSPPNQMHQRSSASGAHDPTKGLSIEILTVYRYFYPTFVGNIKQLYLAYFESANKIYRILHELLS